MIAMTPASAIRHLLAEIDRLQDIVDRHNAAILGLTKAVEELSRRLSEAAPRGSA